MYVRATVTFEAATPDTRHLIAVCDARNTHTCVIRPYPGLICLFGGRTVGIVRRLRYGQSIKPNGDGYDLDLSKMRFKNSKF